MAENIKTDVDRLLLVLKCFKSSIFTKSMEKKCYYQNQK